MHIVTFPGSFEKKCRRLLFICAILFLAPFISASQTRQYTLIYSDNIRGGSVIFGNTLMNIITDNKVDTVKMNGNTDGNSIYGNDNQDMEYVDLDGSSGNGSVTRNSSSADLVLPAGTNTIKLARLYWGGSVRDTDYDLSKTINRTIKIRKGTTNAYSDASALGMDTTTIVSGYREYQAYTDITAFVKNNGAGTYEVGNVPLSTGITGDGGNHGGWSIVVVYENTDLPYNSIRLYDGFQVVYNDGNPTISTVTLTGLDVPSGSLAAADAKMGVVAWEGDANLRGDFLKINGQYFSNPINPFDNPWNGTISDNGIAVNTKNPDYSNQMGIDIDMFEVGTGYNITPNAQSVTLEFGTEADKYYPGVFSFTIKMKDPTITLDKLVTDDNNNHLAESGEILTYTLKGANNGIGNANNTIISDTLPATVTYKPGSLKVISSPGTAPGFKTDQSGDDVAEYVANGGVRSVVFRIGTGATSDSGGILAANETYEVQYQVTVNDPGAGNPVPSIMNIARITSTSDAGLSFVDDGTAIINPEAGPMPVTLSRFTANLLSDNQVQLDWSTSMEISCSRFVIQRSYDGNLFTDRETVAGNGTTSLFHSYTATDPVYSFTGNTIYYRLKEVDIDGKQHISSILPVGLKNTGQPVSVSPNPFTDHININMQWNNTEVISVKIFSVQGKEVFSQRMPVVKGNNLLRINEVSGLPRGNYFLQLLSSTQTMIQKITR